MPQIDEQVAYEYPLEFYEYFKRHRNYSVESLYYRSPEWATVNNLSDAFRSGGMAEVKGYAPSFSQVFVVLQKQ